MARPLSPPPTSPDVSSSNLTLLLNRLEQTLLSPDSRSTRTLRRSVYERNRVSANLEYARSLLLRLEQGSPRGKVQSIRRADLLSKRAMVRKLQIRLDELGKAGDMVHYDDSSASCSSDEDILATYAPARADVSSGIEHIARDSRQQGSSTTPTGAEQVAAAATLVSSLRARGTKGQDAPTSMATGSSTRQAAGLPWSQRSSNAASDKNTTAQVLESHETEQTMLTDSLLTLASALKASTMSFSDNVTASNPLVDRTSQALDKNVGGMEQTSQNLGMLRRMTEGRGWWSRLGLWAKVGVLWSVMLLVMFVMPKLRF
ncbi:MAG: hypothetical protein M1828_005751 [Chrysothrix sp. TS-e1954]|nr:MAG: hypothetical protein M1828_005751 [Chrysothrix sp. TS-e1954]